MSELKLWKFTLIPAIIGLVVGVGIYFLATYLAEDIGSYLSGFWPFEFGQSTVEAIGNFLGGLLVLSVGIIVFKHIVMAFSAPFMTPISEKIEMHLTGKELNLSNTTKEFMTTLSRSIRLNVRNLILELLITLFLLILSLIPLFGMLSIIFLFIVQAFYAGFGNMDYTLERHKNYSNSIKFINKHKGIAIGNGTVFTLMLMIPLLGISLALPISTAAATIDTLNALEEK